MEIPDRIGERIYYNIWIIRKFCFRAATRAKEKSDDGLKSVIALSGIYNDVIIVPE